MDNIGDWLYIVFIVIAAVSSLFSSKKKKQHPTEVLGQPGSEQSRQEEKVPKKNIWDMMEEMTQPNPQPVVQTKKKKKKQEPVPFITGEGDTIPTSRMIIPPSGLVEPEEDCSPEISIDNADDLRRAVIYSEILNRKY